MIITSTRVKYLPELEELATPPSSCFFNTEETVLRSVVSLCHYDVLLQIANVCTLEHVFYPTPGCSSARSRSVILISLPCLWRLVWNTDNGLYQTNPEMSGNPDNVMLTILVELHIDEIPHVQVTVPPCDP